MILGTNLKGSEGNRIRKRERSNCEADTKGTSVFLGGSSEPGMALQNSLELRKGVQASEPLFQLLSDIGSPTLLMKKGQDLGKQLCFSDGRSQGRDSAMSCQWPTLSAVEE